MRQEDQRFKVILKYIASYTFEAKLGYMGHRQDLKRKRRRKGKTEEPKVITKYFFTSFPVYHQIKFKLNFKGKRTTQVRGRSA